MKRRVVAVWAAAAVLFALAGGLAALIGIDLGGWSEAVGIGGSGACLACALACVHQAVDYWRWLL